MVTGSLCRCICGPGHKTRDSLDPTKTWQPKDLEVFDEIDEPPFQLPMVAGRLSYSILADQPLRGTPLREGSLWRLCSEDQIDQVDFSLYVNGFTFCTSEEETSISLSPFALVRTCKFQSGYPVKVPELKLFKVVLFCQRGSYFFGVGAEEDRSGWVHDISWVIRSVTQSIFPPFTITCEPLDSVGSTQRRLMAGYLVHRDDDCFASVLYGELHPHSEDKAKIVFYDNEVCLAPCLEIHITERSLCCEKIGINCSCFSIEDHQFSTRTLPERKLWLRAISNLKVKLQNRAPSPTSEDLKHYRSEIKEYISTMKSNLEGQVQMDALLQCYLHRPRVPMASAAPTMVPVDRAFGASPAKPENTAGTAAAAMLEGRRVADVPASPGVASGTGGSAVMHSGNTSTFVP